MEQNKSPLHSLGYRNVFCPYYGDCLDQAAKHHWQYWSCLECEYKHKQEPVTGSLLSAEGDYPYYSISTSLYKKEDDFSL